VIPNPRSIRSPRVWLPLLVLLIGLLGGVGMVAVTPSVETREAIHLAPLVQVMEIEPKRVQLSVRARGSVVPRTESALVAEVSGRITWVSPGLASGGFVAAGEELVRIDPTDYEIAVERAEAAVARAESALELARTAAARQRTLASREVASSSALESAENQERAAAAGLREARAARRQARRDLARAVVEAPFAGRIREKHVDVGQFVNRGTPVARVYAVDFAEIRLPIPDDQAAFVDLPIAYRDEDAAAAGPEVTLRSRFAGGEHTWTGRIVRTEGEIDPRTRMIHAVARVEDPYGRGDAPGRPPLAVGLFVEAEIRGRSVDGVVELPRTALRGTDEVVVVDDDSRLRIRGVEIVKREHDTVLVSAGLHAGERVLVSPLAVTVDGMQVRVQGDAAPTDRTLAGADVRP
jgi:RND family efflux transporter MFP subunit